MNSNTEAALRMVLTQLEQEGIETELIQIGNRQLWGCQACQQCRDSEDSICHLPDDGMNELIQKAIAADGIIIGSPVYFGNVTPSIKALIDRLGYTTGSKLKNKVGAAVVVARRAGTNFTYAAINYFFGIKQMIIPSSSYWNMSLALKPGDIYEDAEGIRTFETLGQNMAWLMNKIAQD